MGAQKPKKLNISSKELLAAQTVFNPAASREETIKSSKSVQSDTFIEGKDEEPPLTMPVITTTSSAPLSLEKKVKSKSKVKGFKTVKVKSTKVTKHRAVNGSSPALDSFTLDSMDGIESYILQQEEHRSDRIERSISDSTSVSNRYGTPSLGSIGSVGSGHSEYTPDPEDYDSSPAVDTGSFQVVKKEKPKRKK